ncbi:hypothetical protein BDQ12DRAFT_699475 [Crucibulum laeve]|uniref:Peroxisomal biogenesis factor 11 n=1 Tax=Crucibulum laeve TaxID=68775 RepID=A0A5C3LUJ2_9AGAR|nr:hypothetical protein BDQ12DRAFT_699475 [Crucibulum laeve]
MPKPSSKPLTIARLNDAILGCFSRAQPSETVDHLVRFLGTWSGSDKLFMLIQYSVKLLVPILHLRARLQHRAGLRKSPMSGAAEGYAKLSSLLGDSRTLWRIWGLLPIFQWLISIERNPQPTRNLLTIERLQGWSMLLYYPLEHLSYLIGHGIIPASFSLASLPLVSLLAPSSLKSRTLSLNANKLGIWSCRFWALYVLLQFLHLREDKQLLIQKHRNLKKGKALGPNEKWELGRRWDAWWSEVVVNVGYAPLTVHWSLEQGIFKNDVWVGIFGLVAAVASFRAGWKATALPPAPSASAVPSSSAASSNAPSYAAAAARAVDGEEDKEKTAQEKVGAYDVSA